MKHENGAPLLELKDVKTFFKVPGGILKAVNGVSLTIHEGETIGLVGESGCGKSVTSQSILRLYDERRSVRYSGQVLFEGRDLLALPEKEMRAVRGSEIAMVFQDSLSSLNPVLTCGDQIMEIDGVSTIGLEAAQSSDRMKGKPGTTVHFKVKKVRSGEIKDIDIVRERIHLPDIEYAGMLDGETGYVLQTGFTENVSRQIREAFLDLKSKGMKRFILDLRGNGGGLLGEAVNIVSLFVPTGSLVVSQMGRDSTDRREYRTVMTPIDMEMPIAVLVDGASASASEIVAGAIQDLDRGVVMGRRTYGKGLVQSIRPLPYNGQLKVTVAKYYTPSGRCVQAIDYSKREEDGSVGHIPDSLTHEFKTLRLGRSVRDGGGITPDIALTYHPYTRLVYSLVVNGIIEQYTLKYVGEHESIPAVEDFHFTDYNDFVEFAKGKKFDSRTGAMALFDQMKDELVKDGLQDKASAEIEALQKALEISKEELLWLRKDEVTPWIEEEIAVRYYYQGAGIKIRLRYDREVAEALKNSFLLSN